MQLQSQAFTKSARTQAQQFAQTRKQATLMQQTWADATASTGLFDVSSRKIRSHTDEWIKSVQKQRLSLRDLMGDMASYRQARQQQLRMQNMSIASFATDKQGNPLASIAVPRTALRDVDTLRQRLGFSAHVAESISTQMINAGKNMQWAGRQLSMGFTAPLLAAGALSAKFAYDVDKQLTQTAKVYDTYATTQQGKEKELSTLRANQLTQAKQIAKEYGMAAADTASISAQLASAGQRGSSLLKGTKETARFATLGDFDKDSAVQATMTLKSVFGIQNTELKQAVDFMNNIENSTSLTMQDMAEAIPTASAAVKNLNGNYKDMIVLLTAMKERGFDPGESANALKAAGTRLIRPSKRVQEEFLGLTGQSLTDIRDANEGDLIKTLLDVGKATANLGTAQKQQARAAVFGTEQAARLGGAMDGLIKAQSGVGQTAKAMEVAQLSAADNSKVAAQEMKRQQASVSGQLKRAIETIKIQLFDMGIAFLQAATIALKAGSSLIDLFNNLPGVAKKGLVLAAVIAAIAGPLLMFIGLSRNLFGQMLKGAAIMLKLTTGVGLLTTEQKAGAVASEWANKALRSEVNSTEALTLQVAALTNAFREAAVAKANYARVGGPLNMAGSFLTAGAPIQPIAPKPKPQTTASSTYAGFDIMGSAKKKGAGRKIGIGGAGMGVALASMVAMEASSNKTVDNIAKWGMYAGMAMPLFSGLSKRLAFMGTAMGPIGIGVAAVGVGIYAWTKHMDKVHKQFDDMYNDTSKLAKIFGLEDKGRTVNPALENMSAEEKAQKKINEEKAKSATLSDKIAEAYPKLISSIKEAHNDEERYNLALMQGLKVMNMGGTEKQAKAAIKAALDAAQGVADSQKIVARFDVDLSSQKAVTDQLKKQSDRMLADARAARKLIAEQGSPYANAGKAGGGGGANSPQARSIWKKQGTDLGALLFQGINLEGKKGIKVFDDVEKTVNELAQGSEMRARLTADALLKSYGVGEEARKRAIKGMHQEDAGIQDQINLLGLLKDAGVQASLAKTASTSMGIDNYGLKDQQKLQGVYNKAWMGASGSPLEREKAAAEAVTEELTKMNNGVPPLISGFGSMADHMADLGINTSEAGAELEALKRAASGMADAAASDATEQFGKAVRSAAASGHTKALADIEAQGQATQAALDKAADAMETRHQKAQEALDDAQQRAQNRLEERWKKRKKALQDEEDLRKRVFDAEVTRIQRMKELNNDNVDYRVAVNTGNLDEAAKIRNEIGAKQETWSLEDSDKAQATKFEKAMAKLDAQEEAEKKRLDRIQELQDRALAHRQQNEKKALEAQRAAAAKSVEIAKNAENQRYQAQKAALDKGLAYVKAQNPKTQAELNIAIAEAKKKYHIYGNGLEHAAKDWGNNMYSSLAKRIRDAYKAITGQDFGKAGKKIADDFMKGVSGGKITTSQIITYMRTGKLPKAGGDKTPKNTRDRTPIGSHKGGPVRRGSGTGGRGSVNLAGGDRTGYSKSADVMPSEQLILAKQGEYLVNHKAVAKFGINNLDKINALGRHSGGEIGLGNGNAALARTTQVAAIQGGLKKGYQNMVKAQKAAAKKGEVGASGANRGGVDPKGWNSPWKGHYGTSTPHDWLLPSGTPIYAPHAGTAKGHDIPGYEPRVSHGGHGYKSYGRIMEVTGGGANIMFAHMSKRAFNGPKKVKAGQFLGRSGETGNAHGAHVHMELNHGGDNSGVGNFFAKRGVKLLKGGKIRYDNTPAVLHARERVLDPENTSKLDRGIDQIASGNGAGYNGPEQLHIHIEGNGWTPDDIPKLAKEITKEQKKDNSRYSRDPDNT